MAGTVSPRGTVLQDWLNENALMIRHGKCVTCGMPVMDCWCGEYEDEYRPVQADADPGPP